MLLSLYNLLWLLARPLLWRKLRRRGAAEPLYLHATHQRLARYTPAERQQAHAHAGQWVWLHAVSLGEMRAAAIVLNALRAAAPDIRLLLTQSTATGWEQGQRLLRDGDMQVWLPWDSGRGVQRFIHTFRPRLGLIMETEIWPNLLRACQQAAVPVALLNARMSEKTFAQTQHLRTLARQAYGSLAGVYAQTERDAQRLRTLGATPVWVMGNVKFDAQPHPAQLAQGRAWRQQTGRPVLMLASSREGEEQQWLDAWQHLRQTPAGAACQWLIVPRHPQRFDAVHTLLEQAGITVQRRSQWGTTGPATPSAPPTVWLGDSMGEMPLYYGLSHIVLMGGSFAPLGGQNLIEACACACPVLLGPHTFNFQQASEHAIAEGAALRCTNMDDAIQRASALACAEATDTASPGTTAPTLAAMTTAAQQFAQRHQGAAQRTVQHLLQHAGAMLHPKADHGLCN